MTTHGLDVATPRETIDVPSGCPSRIATPLPGDPRLARLSLNQRTTAAWSVREAIDGCLAAGLGAIGLWREPIASVGLSTTKTWIADSGLRVSSICRGGFFTSTRAMYSACAIETQKPSARIE